ncbi:C-C chemokine receptor type 9a [Lampris incognitus]|uniref:C-C chemokine receptor type 9a n=1 Tax=Lampris incognitus TaxID=2546036 RepID=UPI0024B49A84|nr:C-C chemokine receptor type 9a [Lampris incognitus]
MASTTDMMTTTSQNLSIDYDGVPTTTDGEYDYEGLMCDKLSVREFRGRYEPPLFWLITILGGLGNLAVVWVYIHFRHRVKTMTEIYLLNLAVADLLFLCTLPLWAAEASQGWSFGEGLCRVNLALYKVNLFSGMLLLTCISVDRYVVIVQTTKAQNSKRQRLRCSKQVCLVVWLLAMVLALPEFIFAKPKLTEDKEYCRMVYPGNKGNHTKIFVLSLQVSMGFCLPFLIMGFCYCVIICTLLKTRKFEKHRAMRVILVVVMVFVFTQLPHNAVLVVEATQATNITMTDCEQTKRFDVVGQLLKSLAYTHASLNPLLYAFIGVRFRKDVVRLLQAYHCWPSKGQLSKVGKPLSGSMRASVMSDTDTTQALSL